MEFVDVQTENKVINNKIKLYKMKIKFISSSLSELTEWLS